ncbi:helix-turn-helix domain-containing protein [Streptococcus sciuri]|uniref:Helix-turn-helix domain-containing protein n=1 Tax=Streptococcus sciuri TaxID=2973939 RepID=A0ABT2F4X2_9STRE|nr:helix-turn-helix domain-containing protein [Streptococcus sciuri]MCS4487521.1 helix-turn-helix domain-containing protein [Streptococcus sciuri]
MDENQRRQIWSLRSEGFSYGKIATALNLSYNTVKKYCGRFPELKGYGDVVKQMFDEGNGKHCKQCRQLLKHYSKGRPKKFCSDYCRKSWWNAHSDEHDKTKTAYDELTCQNCGRSFLSYANPTRKYCSHECYIQTRFYNGGHNDNSTQHGD